nr:MAG TPA: hypothetical protein [Caudoviricetes sp.]
MTVKRCILKFNFSLFFILIRSRRKIKNRN